MNVFISWSGEQSKRLALLFRDWLPAVIQNIVPFMSDQDIGKGARWFTEIENQLEATNMGIICITNDNQSASWLLYEAGAIAKAVSEKSRVCTVLLNMQPTDVKEPLSHFNHTTADSKEDIKKLLITINNLNDNKINDKTLEFAFNGLWPQYEETLHTEILSMVSQEIAHRSERELIEEILLKVRDISDNMTLPSQKISTDRGHQQIWIRNISDLEDKEFRLSVTEWNMLKEELKRRSGKFNKQNNKGDH